jgi:uncharacterized membrane protein
MNTLAYALHIGGGTIGLGSGLVAAFSRKGGYLHRKAGIVFAVSMLIMATFAFYLAVVLADQVNIFIGIFVFYLVATAWMTVRQGDRMSGPFEKTALIVALCLCAPFGILTFQLVTGMTPMFKSTVPFKGPVLIAIYVFTSVLALAAIGDARLVLRGGLSGTQRITRHLWRMCLGLTLAVGSFFTNALPRLLPPPVHITSIVFLPQLLLLGFLFFWMFRVRFTSWRQY